MFAVHNEVVYKCLLAAACHGDSNVAVTFQVGS